MIAKHENPAPISPLSRHQWAGRLRVGMVAPPFLPVPPTGYGGTERVVSHLVEGLVGRGHDVTLFAAPGSVTASRLVTPLAAPPPLGDPAGVPDEIFHIASAYLRAGEFDLLHDHTGLGPVIGAVAAATTPVVHTLHGPWTAENRRLLQLLHHRVHLVAISAAQRAMNPVLRYAGVVHNGIDLAAHPFRSSKEDFLVFVGRVSPEKRPEVAVEVARRAKLPLVMIVKKSEPAERAYWDELVAPHLGSDTVVLDQPPHEVKVDVMGRARALVFPIDWPEPFGLVVTEAMACGTPVIASPMGAAPEIVCDGVTGYLCATVEEMVDAVPETIWLDPRACRASVEADFSSEAMVAGYEQVYRAVLGHAAAADPGAVRGAAASGSA